MLGPSIYIYILYTCFLHWRRKQNTQKCAWWSLYSKYVRSSFEPKESIGSGSKILVGRLQPLPTHLFHTFFPLEHTHILINQYSTSPPNSQQSTVLSIFSGRLCALSYSWATPVRSSASKTGLTWCPIRMPIRMLILHTHTLAAWDHKDFHDNSCFLVGRHKQNNTPTFLVDAFPCSSKSWAEVGTYKFHLCQPMSTLHPNM